MLMDKVNFCKKYNVKIEDYEHLNSRCDFDSIKLAYAGYLKSLESIGNKIVSSLMKCDKINSVKFRLKDPDHLIAKIIRNNIVTNSKIYRNDVKDLIGVRCLHLFKDDWIVINDYIMHEWSASLVENPTLYRRNGDETDKPIVDYFKDKNWKIVNHPFGYRSCHYHIFDPTDTDRNIVEIQVRTVFEEAWSEIDHQLRYPYYLEDKLLSDQTLILNRIACIGDELATSMEDIKNLPEPKPKTIKEYAQKADIINDAKNYDKILERDKYK